MKMQNKDKLKQIMDLGDDFDNFLVLFELPDEKFKQIYPEIRTQMEQPFTTPEFQQEVINKLRYQQNIDLAEEKAYVEEFIKELKDDDTLSTEKKELLISLIEKSALAVYEMIEVPRQRIKVKIKVLPGGTIPTYAHPTDAGADIYASETVVFEPGETKIVHTAIQVAVPVGYEIQIRPRSGMSLKTGFRIANAPGTIDSDYRGEIGVIMTNTSNEPATIEKGDKIAQMVISPVPMIKWVETDNLDETERGEGGFGSTDES